MCCLVTGGKGSSVSGSWVLVLVLMVGDLVCAALQGARREL